MLASFSVGTLRLSRRSIRCAACGTERRHVCWSSSAHQGPANRRFCVQDFFRCSTRRPDLLAIGNYPSERAAITGEAGLLRALEGAFALARIAVPRADLRVAIQGGAAKLRPLLQTFTDNATPIAVEIAKPKPPALNPLIDQGEELFLAEGQNEALPFLALLRDLLKKDTPAVIAIFTIRSDNYATFWDSPKNWKVYASKR